MSKIFGHPLTIILVTLCVIVFSINMSKSERRKSNYQPQVSMLEAKEKELLTQKEIFAFKKELSAKSIVQEKIIRDELWRQKPGEIILDLEDYQKTPPASPPPPPIATTPLEQWQNMFFDISLTSNN